MTITEFLLARIAEDEALAREATPGPWERDGMDAGHSRYETNWWITTAEGDSICDMDGLSRSQNEAVATDDGGSDAAHIARYDPARVLAECDAKRAIIERHPIHVYQGIHGQDVPECAVGDGFPCDTLQALAAVYADHPDYRQEWAL